MRRQVALKLLPAYMAGCANRHRYAGASLRPTRNVVLTDHQAGLVERLVASGRYQNASDALRDGLRLLEGQEAQGKARLKALREAATIGGADIDAVRFWEFESPAMLARHLGSVANATIGRSRESARAK